MNEQSSAPTSVPIRQLQWSAWALRALPLAVALGACLIYLTTLSNVHTYDALSYVRDVDERSGFFFHPHHLLYSPTGWLFWRLWQLAGYGGNSELPLQVLNSLAAAVCGLGVYHLVRALTGRWWAALGAMLLFLFNFGVWYFGVEVEVYHLALVWLVATLALAIEMAQAPKRRTAPLLGLAIGLAALYHQTNGLLVPVAIVAVALGPGSWRARLLRLIATGVVAGGIVALGYFLVGYGLAGYRSAAAFRDWMFFYVETGWWGQATRDRLTDLGVGLGNSLSAEGAAALWAAVIALLLVGIVPAIRRWPRVVVVCASWILVFGGFFAWWEAENIEFWIASLLPLWVLIGLGLAARGDTLAPRSAWRAALQGIAVGAPLLLLPYNYPLIKERGDASLDMQHHLAREVHNITTPADLIVGPGGVLELYLPYYEDRHHITTLNGTLFDTDGDIDLALARLRDEVEQALHAGLAVVVGRDMLQLPTDTVRRYPVTQAQLDAFWAPYTAALQPAVTLDGKTYFWKLPPATAVLTQTGWTWQSFRWGWTAGNVEREQVTDGGWCFAPLVDPALTSPLLSVDAAQYRTLTITLATAVPGQQAQLFWAGPDGALSEERSIQWPVEGDGQPHTYTLDLAAIEGWSGTVTRFRLDPIALGGGEPEPTCIQELRLGK